MVSLASLRAFAIGVMRMTRLEFQRMRVGEFYDSLHMFIQERMMDRRLQAELVRNQTLILVNLQLPRNKQLNSASALWPMPWDDKETVSVKDIEMDKEKIKELIQF